MEPRRKVHIRVEQIAMSLNCDSQNPRAPLPHRSALPEADCALRTSRQSTAPLLLSKATLRRGIGRSLTDPYAGIEASAAALGSERSVGGEGARREVTVTEIAQSIRVPNQRRRPKILSESGVGAPRATILPSRLCRQAHSESAGSVQDMPGLFRERERPERPKATHCIKMGGWESGYLQTVLSKP